MHTACAAANALRWCNGQPLLRPYQGLAMAPMSHDAATGPHTHSRWTPLVSTTPNEATGNTVHGEVMNIRACCHHSQLKPPEIPLTQQPASLAPPGTIHPYGPDWGANQKHACESGRQHPNLRTTVCHCYYSNQTNMPHTYTRHCDPMSHMNTVLRIEMLPSLGHPPVKDFHQVQGCVPCMALECRILYQH
jgi:hypothetical protein